MQIEHILEPEKGKKKRWAAKDVVSRHSSKVYGKAAIGAPPMSATRLKKLRCDVNEVPHLDARKIGGNPVLLFGPFAGFSPRHQLVLPLRLYARMIMYVSMLESGGEVLEDGLGAGSLQISTVAQRAACRRGRSSQSGPLQISPTSASWHGFGSLAKAKRLSEAGNKLVACQTA